MNTQKTPLTTAQRMKAKRLRNKALHQRLGGKEKRIHFFDFTMRHIEILMEKGQYSNEDEAITDALAVATLLIQIDSGYFNELLTKARQLKEV